MCQVLVKHLSSIFAEVFLLGSSFWHSLKSSRQKYLLPKTKGSSFWEDDPPKTRMALGLQSLGLG